MAWKKWVRSVRNLHMTGDVLFLFVLFVSGRHFFMYIMECRIFNSLSSFKLQQFVSHLVLCHLYKTSNQGSL